MKPPLHLRIFLSSPADVAVERARAVTLIRNLPHQPLLRGKVTIELVAWDDPLASAPLRAGAAPQRSVDTYKGDSASCDLTVAILWSRLGTPVSADDGRSFVSGTASEIESALRADKPVFLYVRIQEPTFDENDSELREKRGQYRNLQAFVQTIRDPNGRLRGGVNWYTTEAEFSRLLEQHLEAEVRRRLDGSPRRRHIAVALCGVVPLVVAIGWKSLSGSRIAATSSSPPVSAAVEIVGSVPVPPSSGVPSAEPPAPPSSSSAGGSRIAQPALRACSSDASCRRCSIGDVIHPTNEYDASLVEQLKLSCARDRTPTVTAGVYRAPCLCEREGMRRRSSQ